MLHKPYQEWNLLAIALFYSFLLLRKLKPILSGHFPAVEQMNVKHKQADRRKSLTLCLSL